MITQKLLDKAVSEVLPTRYRTPDSENITSINCVTSDRLRAIRQSFYPELPMPEGFIGAITLNLEYLYYSSEVEDLTPYEGKFSVWIAQEVDNIQELQYVLLNQLGQVDLQLNFSDIENVDSKLYADFFALGGLQKIYDSKTAMAIVYKYGSI